MSDESWEAIKSEQYAATQAGLERARIAKVEIKNEQLTAEVAELEAELERVKAERDHWSARHAEQVASHCKLIEAFGAERAAHEKTKADIREAVSEAVDSDVSPAAVELRRTFVLSFERIGALSPVDATDLRARAEKLREALQSIVMQWNTEPEGQIDGARIDFAEQVLAATEVKP